MANQGKRMVKENLIAQIGQGGGGTEYTAGTGIDITEDVISVDTDTIATKEEVTEVESKVMPTYGLQGHALSEYSTIAELMEAGCPILSTSETESTYPDNVINLNKGDAFYLYGIFALKGQDGNYRIFITSDGTGLQGTLRYNASKVANRDYLVKQARFRYNTTFDGSTVATLAMTGGGDLILSSNSSYVANSGVAGMKLPIHLANPTVNVRFDQQLDAPTTDGTYTLDAIVTDGVPEFGWDVAPTPIPSADGYADGTYALKVTVTDGEPFYEWVLEV